MYEIHLDLVDVWLYNEFSFPNKTNAEVQNGRKNRN